MPRSTTTSRTRKPIAKDSQCLAVLDDVIDRDVELVAAKIAELERTVAAGIHQVTILRNHLRTLQLAVLEPTHLVTTGDGESYKVRLRDKCEEYIS